MLSAVLILFLCLFIIFFIPNFGTQEEEEEDDVQKDPQIKRLFGLAQGAIREHKPLKAEKALLTILKFDEKNAAAYNRLGILYAKERHFKEAVDCFEIAQSLDNNASSLHNVGLIYYETGKYEKAAMAFSQALELEGDQPGRYIAYAKALEKLGERAKAVEALETAYSLNPTAVVLRHILEIHENNNDTEAAEQIRHRIEELQNARAAAAEAAAKAKERERQKRLAMRQAQRAARADARIARAGVRSANAAQRREQRLARQAARPTRIIRRPGAPAVKTSSKITVKKDEK